VSQTTAVLSMLHEPLPLEQGGQIIARDSAGRLFRGQPVLAWTLARLSRARKLASAVILCWEDQADAVRPIARETGAEMLIRSAREPLAPLDSVSAALRWTDGWRGGLLGASHFDRGFFAPACAEAMTLASASAAVLIDPSSGLIDPRLIDELIDHAAAHPDLEYVFSQAAPGLCGLLVRTVLIDRLSKVLTHPGRLLNYWPDTPGRDPITSDSCLAVAPQIARTLHRFTLDSARQTRRLSAATESLNGQLISTDARGLVAVLDACPSNDPLPRDVTLEINTRRATRPIYAAGTHLPIARGDMSVEQIRQIIEQLGETDDLRLTLAGAGDPALHPEFPAIARLLAESGIPALHIETDLLDLSDEAMAALVNGRFDMVSVHLPAATAPTYERVMGVAKIEQVVKNLCRLLQLRTGPTPIIVPTFTKCRENLDEMEAWYDSFLKSVGVAVIAGPSDFAGQIPDHACADMSPPRRRPCQRIRTRMTILSDGSIPACEQDALAKYPAANASETTLTNTWRTKLAVLRQDHEAGNLSQRPLCQACREWHRP